MSVQAVVPLGELASPALHEVGQVVGLAALATLDVGDRAQHPPLAQHDQPRRAYRPLTLDNHHELMVDTSLPRNKGSHRLKVRRWQTVRVPSRVKRVAGPAM